MKRLNQYLLAHYPLLWNTRVVWVLSANVILHLLFFLGGLASINVKTLAGYYSVGRVGGETMYTFSVLCALLVVIVWCVFYLRNNAFKSFYRLPEFYLAEEFAIIFLILITTISYSQSFEWGVKMRVRSITGEKEFVYEMTEVNKGIVYVPTEKARYFLLNNCAEKAKEHGLPERIIAPPEPGQFYGAADSARVRAALAQPGAFSYANYCSQWLAYTSYPTEGAEAVSARNKAWLAAGRRDSVKQSIVQLLSVLNKYGIEYRLDADDLTDAVFRDSLFTMNATVPVQRFNYQYGEQENKEYLNANDLQQVFRFIEDCQPSADNWQHRKNVWNVIGYFALGFSILLLCYRRFSRKVFLISTVGTLVWMILIGLVAAGSYGSRDGIPSLLLLLCAAFLLAGVGLLASRSSKTTTGVLLNWHVYLVPFAVMLIVALIDNYHDAQVSRYYGHETLDTDVLMQQNYPFSTWVVKHAVDILLLNIVGVACYVAFVFNGLAKRWQLLPEE